MYLCSNHTTVCKSPRIPHQKKSVETRLTYNSLAQLYRKTRKEKKKPQSTVKPKKKPQAKKVKSKQKTKKQLMLLERR